MDGLNGVDAHWLWLAAGLLLLTGELLAPGIYLMWFGLAALATGVAAAALPIGLAPQLVLFAVVAVAAVYRGRQMLIDRPIVSDDPMLNDRAARLVGQTVVVRDAIEGGRGRVAVGDSVWAADGADAPVGTRLRVEGVRDGVLAVAPLRSGLPYDPA